jgi:hypothetical protein
MTPTEQKIASAFSMIEAAAVKGVRCPENYDLPLTTAAVALAKQGKIKIEISGRNYRQVTILVGPNAGKTTAPNPKGHSTWMVLGTTKFRNGLRVNPQVESDRRKAAQERRQRLAVRLGRGD